MLEWKFVAKSCNHRVDFSRNGCFVGTKKCVFFCHLIITFGPCQTDKLFLLFFCSFCYGMINYSFLNSPPKLGGWKAENGGHIVPLLLLLPLLAEWEIPFGKSLVRHIYLLAQILWPYYIALISSCVPLGRSLSQEQVKGGKDVGKSRQRLRYCYTPAT